MKLFLLVITISRTIMKDYTKFFSKTQGERINEKQIYDNHNTTREIIQSKQFFTYLPILFGSFPVKTMNVTFSVFYSYLRKADLTCECQESSTISI